MEIKKQVLNTDDLQTTLRFMNSLIQTGSADLNIRNFAIRIGNFSDGREYDKIAQNIFNWMKENLRYVHDPISTEWLQSAEVTLKLKTGDCDDFTIFAGTLLESLGIKTRIVVGKFNGNFSHVWLQYWSNVQNKWVAFDAIGMFNPKTQKREMPLMGWEHPKTEEKMIVERNGQNFMGYTKLGATDGEKIAAAAAVATAAYASAGLSVLIPAVATFLASIGSDLKNLSLNNMFGPSADKLIGIDGEESEFTTQSSTAKWFNKFIAEKLFEFKKALESKDLATALKVQTLFNRLFEGARDGSNTDNSFYYNFISEQDNTTKNAWKQDRKEGGFGYEHSLKPARDIVNKSIASGTYAYNQAINNPGTTPENKNTSGGIIDFPAMPENPSGFGTFDVSRIATVYGQLQLVNEKLSLWQRGKTGTSDKPNISLSAADTVNRDAVANVWNVVNTYRNKLAQLGTSTPVFAPAEANTGLIVGGILATIVVGSILAGKKKSKS